MNAKSNASRFIMAYNRLDKGLRDIYNLKPSLSFSDCIRKTASVNMVIKKHEDALIDFGRLRNAIVHRSDDSIIAEPHDDVVEKLELITRLITTPPIASKSGFTRNVLVAEGKAKLGDILVQMYKTGYSNVPVYLDQTLVGVITRKMITDALGKAIAEDGDIKKLTSKPVVEALEVLDHSDHYEVVDENATIDNLLYMFQQNRKLSTIIITPNGNYNQKPIGIVVTADIIDMQTVLDNY